MSCMFQPPVRIKYSTLLNINQVTVQTQFFRNTREQRARLCVCRLQQTPKLHLIVISELQPHGLSDSLLRKSSEGFFDFLKFVGQDIDFASCLIFWSVTTGSLTRISP